MPRYKDVILLGDLIDCARPGEEIDVTGIYVHNQHTLSKDKTGFPVFSTGSLVGWSEYDWLYKQVIVVEVISGYVCMYVCM